MADIRAGQRVRIWDGTNDLGAALANPFFVNLSDGTNSLSMDANGRPNINIVDPLPAGTNNIGDVDIASALPAGTNNIGDVDVLSVIPGVGVTNLGKAIDQASTGADVGVAPLAIRDDVLTTLTPIEGDYVPLRVSSTGALWVTLTSSGNSNIIQDDSAFTPGTSYVGAVGYLADETAPDTVDEGDIGAPRMTLNRIALSTIADATTPSQRLAIGATGAASMNLTQVLGAAHSETNPVYVQIVSGAVSGTEIIVTLTSAALAKDANVDLDYTVTAAKTAKVHWIRACGSGATKLTVSTGPVAGLTIRERAFGTPSNPNIALNYEGLLEVPDTSTGTIRANMRNDDNTAQDVYVTMVLHEV